MKNTFKALAIIILSAGAMTLASCSSSPAPQVDTSMGAMGGSTGGGYISQQK